MLVTLCPGKRSQGTFYKNKWYILVYLGSLEDFLKRTVCYLFLAYHSANKQINKTTTNLTSPVIVHMSDVDRWRQNGWTRLNQRKFISCSANDEVFILFQDCYYRHPTHGIVRPCLAFTGRSGRPEDVQLFVASEKSRYRIQYMYTAALIQPQQTTQTHPSTQTYTVTHCLFTGRDTLHILHTHTVHWYVWSQMCNLHAHTHHSMFMWQCRVHVTDKGR